jgi:hypothetical protein
MKVWQRADLLLDTREVENPMPLMLIDLEEKMGEIPTEQADKVIAILMECMEREGIGGRVFPVRTSDKETSGFHVVFTGVDTPKET